MSSKDKFSIPRSKKLAWSGHPQTLRFSSADSLSWTETFVISSRNSWIFAFGPRLRQPGFKSDILHSGYDSKLSWTFDTGTSISKSCFSDEILYIGKKIRLSQLSISPVCFCRKFLILRKESGIDLLASLHTVTGCWQTPGLATIVFQVNVALFLPENWIQLYY